MLEPLRSARLELYHGAPLLLQQLAHVSGVTFSDESIDNMTEASTLIGLIDHVVDRGSAEEYDTMMTYWSDLYDHDPPEHPTTVPPTLDTRLADAATTLRRNISGERAARFIGAGRTAIKLANLYRGESDPKVYARLTFKEGVAAADMYDAVITPNDTNQPQYERYASEVRLLGGISNVIDSVYDLRKDFDRAETAIPPSLNNRWRMLREIDGDIATAVSAINVRLLPLLGSSAIAFGRAWRQRRIDRRELGSIAVVPRP